MRNESKIESEKTGAALRRECGANAAHKPQARRNSPQSLCHGTGTMGLIGWSVAVPILLGLALGSWLDNRRPGGPFWSLLLLLVGLLVGCLVTWHWVFKEGKKGQDRTENKGG